MGASGGRRRIPHYVATSIISIEDEGEYWRITYGMHHDGIDEAVVSVMLTPSAYQSLAQRLALGTRRRFSS